MLQSNFFLKTQKEPPKDEVFKGTQLLLRAGFIDKLMAGSYTLLPLGLKVLKKIENIIRWELDRTGAQEMLMPLMHPKELWQTTGRWQSAKEVMFQLERDGKEFALAFTHEEVLVDVIRKRNLSYKDLPLALYHFSTKFRNELRPRSGLLRGVEFLMNDLYSLHKSEEDFNNYYSEVKSAYTKIFKQLGLKTKIVEAGGGVFTDSVTHEFQVLAESGEDTIFYCNNCDWAQNKEIAEVKDGDKCPECDGTVEMSRAIEVGNIFPLGTWFSEKMNLYFTDENGKQQHPWFASYGIGTSRAIGALAEVYNDEAGLMWPQSVAPFKVHLLRIGDSSPAKDRADEAYESLKDKIEVLYDDREDVSAGEKFAEADLIGIPFRVVVSDKTQNGEAELKKRDEKEAGILKLEDIVKKLKE